MQLGGSKRRIKLKNDLTKYDERCTKGEEGCTMPDTAYSCWGDSDNFVAIQFDNGAKMDIANTSIEILD